MIIATKLLPTQGRVASAVLLAMFGWIAAIAISVLVELHAVLAVGGPALLKDVVDVAGVGLRVTRKLPNRSCTNPPVCASAYANGIASASTTAVKKWPYLHAGGRPSWSSPAGSV